jgi:phytoene dehydrogenase-like protein
VTRHDVAIVGGGHNGLVCATYLARAGLTVGVYERRPCVGGPVVTEEVWPGYRISVAAFWMSLLQPRIMIDLRLPERGLQVVSTPPAFHPFADGTSLVFWDSEARVVEEIRRFSAKDAEAYPHFVAHMDGLMPFLRRLLFEIPVDPSTGRLADLARTAALAWRFRDLGRRAHDIVDLLTLSAHEYLRRWFTSESLLTAFGCYASGSGGNLSPRTPGSAFVLARPLLRDNTTAAGPSGLVKGGMGAVSAALLEAAQEAGVTVRVNAPVERIETRAGRATGLRLASGETVEAAIIVANANAQTVFLRLIERSALPPDFISAVSRIRTDSSCFKINVAADELPRWTAWESRKVEGPPGSITIAENLEELEEAFEAARHGRIAPHPYLWLVTPSAFDPTVAPAGKHVVGIFGGHVPYALAGRVWDDAARDELFAIVIRQIERYAPGFAPHVIHKQVLVPPDLERMFDLPGGHVHHGELTLDQVFFRRPVPGCAGYRSPLQSLYQCGASTHPGGGVTGVPGYNAARLILRDLGGKRIAPSRASARRSQN